MRLVAVRHRLSRTTRLLTAVAVGATLAATGAVAHANGAPPPASRPYGPDVSSHNHPGGAGIDWGAVRAGGSTFMFTKATEGTGYRNPYFAADWSGARDAGLVRGVYHYARPQLPLSSAVDQAHYYLDDVAGRTTEPGSMAPVLDLEEAGTLSSADLVAWTHLWLDTITAATGRTPVIYTYPYFYTGALASTRDFGAYPLWIASYNSGTHPSFVPSGWPTWTFWQSTSTGGSPGINGQVDMSSFAGAPPDLGYVGDGRTEVDRRWAQLGSGTGVLGNPTGDEVALGSGRGRQFAAGSVYWTVPTGAHALLGAIDTSYRTDGGPASVLGLPISDTVPVPGGSAVSFQDGQIYSGAQGAYALSGPVLARYLDGGGSYSPLGLPVTDVYPTDNGTQADFQHGSIGYDASTGVASVLPPGSSRLPGAYTGAPVEGFLPAGPLGRQRVRGSAPAASQPRPRSAQPHATASR